MLNLRKRSTRFHVIDERAYLDCRIPWSMRLMFYTVMRPMGGMVGIGAVLGTGLGKNAWLMLDLGKVEEFSQGFLKERHSRILEYVVEYPDPESKDWVEVFSVARLDYLSYKMAKPVQTQYTRVRLTKTEGGVVRLANIHLHK